MKRLAPFVLLAILASGCADPVGGASSTSPAVTVPVPATDATHAPVAAPAEPDEQSPPQFAAPARGIAVFENQRTIFYDMAGTELGTWESDNLFMLDDNLPALVLNYAGGLAYSVLETGVVDAERISRYSPCQPGFSVCGDLSSGFEMLHTPSGSSVRTPYSIPEGERAPGFWLFAIANPDNTHAIGQYSAECEVPSAALVDAEGEVVWHLEQTTALGWDDDEAIVKVISGACGEPPADPGIYRVTLGGTLELIVEGVFAAAAMWDLGVDSCSYVAMPSSLTPTSSVMGNFDRTAEPISGTLAQDHSGAWWLLIDHASPRRLDGFAFPPDSKETFSDGSSFRIEFAADLTGDGIDELVIDPGIGNDQRLYPIELTSCSGRAIPTPDGNPFFFEVAAGPTYEAGYECWDLDRVLGIVTVVARGPRDDSGAIDAEVIQTGWRFLGGIMEPTDLAAATPSLTPCPGRP